MCTGVTLAEHSLSIEIAQTCCLLSEFLRSLKLRCTLFDAWYFEPAVSIELEILPISPGRRRRLKSENNIYAHSGEPLWRDIEVKLSGPKFYSRESVLDLCDGFP